jgi:hypothetical protein
MTAPSPPEASPSLGASLKPRRRLSPALSSTPSAQRLVRGAASSSGTISPKIEARPHGDALAAGTRQQEAFAAPLDSQNGKSGSSRSASPSPRWRLEDFNLPPESAWYGRGRGWCTTHACSDDVVDVTAFVTRSGLPLRDRWLKTQPRSSAATFGCWSTRCAASGR